jgi:hypothetical protein
MAIDAKAREDFTLFVITPHRRHAKQQRIRRPSHRTGLASASAHRLVFCDSV